MKYQIVMPFIHRPYMEECMATIKLPKENILLVDNTEINHGVACSWNKGIEKMKERGADWLIILSAAMRFGEKGMQDFIDEIEKTEVDILACEPSHGWHCIAIRSSVFERVGTFDENFYPIYFEDNDFGIRCNLQGSIRWGSVEGIQLQNMGNQIQKVNAFYLEVNEKELYKGCALIGDIDEYLGRFGFYRAETKWASENNTLGWGDALYLRK